MSGEVLTCCMLCLFCFLRGTASAQNLLKNPRFDQDLSSWQTVANERSSPGGVSWSPLDANGSSSSGSLEFRTSATSGRETYSVGQCVLIPNPTDYAVFGGRIRVPSGQQAAGFAYLSLKHFSSKDCSGPEGSQSGLEGIANADFWSRRTDYSNIRGAASVRLIASSYKRYEWQEGDQTGQIDDDIIFHAFFDDLFLYVTTAKDLTKLVRSFPTDLHEHRSGNGATAMWGKNAVAAPTLSVRVLGKDGREREERIVELSSLEQIRLAISLKTPYSYDDPLLYPLQPLTLAALNNQENFGKRPTLELSIYRAGDSARKRLEIAVSESGSGVVEGTLTNSAEINLLGRSAFRIRTLRVIYDCMKNALPAKVQIETEPTDDQLFALPLAQYYVANSPGDYELVARYLALEAGLWHDPVYSEPLRIKIVEKKVECRNPNPNAR